jgi:adenylate cyclase
MGGKLIGLAGYKPSRKNPNLCNRCCDVLPLGGAEVDIAILFADVRGSTTLGERLEPRAYAAVLSRYYRIATEILIRHDAIIDKLIGDEVMALFIPGICGSQYRRRATEAALALLRAMRDQGPADPQVLIGASVNSGIAYVGNVGTEGVTDFTALGDTVNTAARLASSAAAGEILLTEPVYAAVAERFPNLERRDLPLRGKQSPVTVRVLREPS